MTDVMDFAGLAFLLALILYFPISQLISVIRNKRK